MREPDFEHCIGADGIYFGEFLREESCLCDAHTDVYVYLPDFPKELDLDFERQVEYDEVDDTIDRDEYIAWFCHVLPKQGSIDIGVDPLPQLVDDMEKDADGTSHWTYPHSWGDMLRRAVKQAVEGFLDASTLERYEAPAQYYLQADLLKKWYKKWSKKGYPLTKETPPWEK